MIVSRTVENIKNSIEDRVIQKSQIKNEINDLLDTIKVDLDARIEKAKPALISFKEQSFQRLPGLKDRILRDSRRVRYINNGLPYKRKHKSKKR